jgi:glucose-1-phosphate adenylyltransferase
VRRVVALVLAGGSGEGLSVLTAERAVSAVPFGGKYRVIDFALSNCCHSEVAKVAVLTQHQPASLHDHIGAGRPWDLDRRAGGVLLLQPYVARNHTGWYRGTADAIVQNWDVIEDLGAERTLVLSGDHVYRMDFRQLLMTHERGKARVSMAVARVAASQSHRFGMVTLDGSGRVMRLDEKPGEADTPYASMGIYVFETALLASILQDRPVDLVRDVLQVLLESGEDVHAHEFTGYWEDIGGVGPYYRANHELLQHAPRLVLHDPRWPVLTRDEERPPVVVGERAVIEQSLVANGCRVAGTVRRSVLFPGVTVEAGAEVIDAVVMQDTWIARGARADHAVIDKHVRISEGAVVGHGAAPADPATAWLEGLTIVGKDAVIPPEARVGRSAVIGIGAGAEEVGGEVAPGTVIASRAWYEDVVR